MHGLEASVILDRVKSLDHGIGFDSLNEQYVDMKKVGIVDPKKVTRIALQNAGSVAAMILTTERLIAEKPESKCCSCSTNDMSQGIEEMY